MLERPMPMGRNLVVGGKLNAEGKRDCFVWGAFNYGNFRTRRWPWSLPIWDLTRPRYPTEGLFCLRDREVPDYHL